MKKSKILYVLNTTKYFAQHRLDLARQAKSVGFDISLAAYDNDADFTSEIVGRGIKVTDLRLQMRGNSPWQEICAFFSLLKLIRRTRPDVIHCITIKPVIYTGLICRVLGRPMIALIPGLGSAFNTKGLVGWLYKSAASALYRLALANPKNIVCFENEDDKLYFVQRGLVPKEAAVRVMGSGINLRRFQFSPYNLQKNKPRVVLMAARLLRDKGVYEFVKAASEVHKVRRDVEFRLVGAPDFNNPSTYTETEVQILCKTHGVIYLGFRKNMPEIVAESDIFCLPSYFEGLPVSLLEAAAMGRPIVTTDVPGCRDVVIHEETGLLVRPRSVDDLAKAILALLSDAETSRKYSERSRQRVETYFEAQKIHSFYLKSYEKLLS